MTKLRKAFATVLLAVAFMCMGISFIVFCVFHSETHTVERTLEIGVPAAVLLAAVAAGVYPGRVPVPGGN